MILHSFEPARVTSSVGIPVDELSVTDALARQAPEILPPRRGFRLFVFAELDSDHGRPDMALVAMSSTALKARLRQGMRLNTASEARVLAAFWSGSRTRYTDSHVRSIRARLVGGGWPLGECNAMPDEYRIVRESIVIEAKVADWRSGVRQLARSRWMANRLALAVPQSSVARIGRPILNRYRMGLIATAADGSVVALRKGRRQKLSLAGDLWLSELGIRALESTP